MTQNSFVPPTDRAPMAIFLVGPPERGSRIWSQFLFSTLQKEYESLAPEGLTDEERTAYARERLPVYCSTMHSIRKIAEHRTQESGQRVYLRDIFDECADGIEKRIRERFTQAVADGRDIVLDRMNPTINSRSTFLEILQTGASASYLKVAVEFRIPPAELQRRYDTLFEKGEHELPPEAFKGLIERSQNPGQVLQNPEGGPKWAWTWPRDKEEFDYISQERLLGPEEQPEELHPRYEAHIDGLHYALARMLPGRGPWPPKPDNEEAVKHSLHAHEEFYGLLPSLQAKIIDEYLGTPPALRPSPFAQHFLDNAPESEPQPGPQAS